MVLPADLLQVGDQIVVQAYEITGCMTFVHRLGCEMEAFTLVDSRKQGRGLTTSTRGTLDLDLVAHTDAPGLDKIDKGIVGPVAECTRHIGVGAPTIEVKELRLGVGVPQALRRPRQGGCKVPNCLLLFSRGYGLQIGPQPLVIGSVPSWERDGSEATAFP